MEKENLENVETTEESGATPEVKVETEKKSIAETEIVFEKTPEKEFKPLEKPVEAEAQLPKEVVAPVRAAAPRGAGHSSGGFQGRDDRPRFDRDRQNDGRRPRNFDKREDKKKLLEGHLRTDI